MYAMLLARFKMFPEVKEKGMSSVPRLVAFTSEHVGIRASAQPIDISTVPDETVTPDRYSGLYLTSNVRDLHPWCRNDRKWHVP